MATRYWVGPQTGEFLSNANWNTVQGVYPGAAALTTSDIFIVDGTSPFGATTNITLGGAITMNSLNVTQSYVTISSTTASHYTMTIAANLYLAYGCTWYGPGITFTSTGTITTNGTTIQCLSTAQIAMTGTRTLGDSLTMTSALAASNYGFVMSGGTLDLNDFTLSVPNLGLSATVSGRTINFRTYSAIYLSGPYGVQNGSTNTCSFTSTTYAAYEKPIYWNNDSMGSTTWPQAIAGAPSLYITGGTQVSSSPPFYSANLKNVTIDSAYKWRGTTGWQPGLLNFSGSVRFGGVATSGGLFNMALNANLNFIGSDFTYVQPTRYLRWGGMTVNCSPTANIQVFFNTGGTQGPSGNNVTWVLEDAVTFSPTANVTLQNGGIDLAGFTMTCGSFIQGGQVNWLYWNGYNPALPGGTLVCAANTTYAFAVNTSAGGSTGIGSYANIQAGYSTGKVSLTGAGPKSVISSGKYIEGIISQDGAGVLTIANTGHTFSGLSCTYTGGTCNIVMQSGGNTTLLSGNSNWAVNGTGAGSVKLYTNNTVVVSGLANTTSRHSITKSDGGFGNYLDARDINFYPQPITDGSQPFSWNLGLNSSANNCTGAACISSQQVMYVIAGYVVTYTWTTPSDWNPSNNYIAVYGAGGGGSGGVRTNQYYGAGAGGGGGGFAGFANYPAPAEKTIPLSIGAGGYGGAGSTVNPGPTQSIGSDGGSTSFGNSTYGIITAYGGLAGQSASSNVVGSQYSYSYGGAGGSGTGPTGTVVYSGGAGGSHIQVQTATASYSHGAGGGGAGGRLGAGAVGGNGSIYTTTTNLCAGGGGGSGGVRGANAGLGAATGGIVGGNNYYGFGGGFSNTGSAAYQNGYSGGGAAPRSGSAIYYPLGGVDMYYGAGAGGGYAGSNYANPYSPTQSTTSNSMAIMIGGGGGGGGNSPGSGTNGNDGGIVILYTRYIAPVGGGGGFLEFF
jgi:hypothetical protein